MRTHYHAAPHEVVSLRLKDSILPNEALDYYLTQFSRPLTPLKDHMQLQAVY